MADVPEMPAPVGKALCKHILKIDGITRGRLARALGISRQSLSDLVNDRRPVTAELALRLARVLGTTPEFWMDLQRDVDLRIAREQIGSVVDALPELSRPFATDRTATSSVGRPIETAGFRGLIARWLGCPP